MQKVQLFIIDAVLMVVKELTNMSRYVNMKIQAKETESLESISEMRLHVGYASDLAIREMACVIKVYDFKEFRYEGKELYVLRGPVYVFID